MLKFAAIASGSNGNCYYVSSGTDAVLVDAGISAKEIRLRAGRLGLDLAMIRAVFISHEHADHIRGVAELARQLGLAVYITEKTYAAYEGNGIDPARLHFFVPGTPVTLGDIRVHPFQKNHDAVEPCFFSMTSKDKNVAVMTDIGRECEHVIACLREADAVFLESNYDDDMLGEGTYPPHLKKRIASDVGHLSNTQAATLILKHATPRLSHVVLSHLSGNNNAPDLAYRTFLRITGQRSDLQTQVVMTSRDRESQLMELG